MKFLHGLTTGTFDVAIDVGAALGGYAWILSRKSRRVIAFEPGKTHADFLELGIQNTNVELERKAVGNLDDVVPMYTPGEDTHARHSATLSTNNPVVHAGETLVTNVQLVSLDQYLDKALTEKERLDFLKVDVEGFELEVFQGSVKRIARDFPLILCEIEARHNDKYREVFSLLRSLGYSSCIYRNNRFEQFDGDNLLHLQKDQDLEYRLGPDYRPGKSKYINNFMFSHPNSKVRVP
jgi:FkbM family methyltransferase